MNENILKLIELAKENPDLEIKCMVDYDACPSDDCSWWVAELIDIEINEYFISDKYYDERWYVGYDEIMDYIDIHDDEFIDIPPEQIYEGLKTEGKIKRAIFVKIGI